MCLRSWERQCAKLVRADLTAQTFCNQSTVCFPTANFWDGFRPKTLRNLWNLFSVLKVRREARLETLASTPWMFRLESGCHHSWISPAHHLLPVICMSLLRVLMRKGKQFKTIFFYWGILNSITGIWEALGFWWQTWNAPPLLDIHVLFFSPQ